MSDQQYTSHDSDSDREGDNYNEGEMLIVSLAARYLMTRGLKERLGEERYSELIETGRTRLENDILDTHGQGIEGESEGDNESDSENDSENDESTYELIK